MITFLFIMFLVLWGVLVFVSVSILRNSKNESEIANYVYTPNIEVGDIVKLANTRYKESPDLLNKNFEVTRIVDDAVFLTSDDNIMITRYLDEVEKLYNF